MRNKVYKEWLIKAENDLDVAVVLLKSRKKTVPDAITFHCQQSAEKYFKAFLCFHNKRFSKTHNLIVLVDMCKVIDSSFELIRDLAQFLNQYSVEVRYPGDSANFKDAKKTLAAAKSIREFVRSKI